MFPPFVMLDSFAIAIFLLLFEIGSAGSVRTQSKLFGFVSVAKNRVELDPSHVGFGDEGLVAAGTFSYGGLLGP
jgi:hypothetical protein